MTLPPSATYCRACSFRIAPRGTLPPYVATCRCISPVPYEIVVDQGKIKAVRPRGPRNKKAVEEAVVEEVVRPAKTINPISKQLSLLLQAELEERGRTGFRVVDAAREMGVGSNTLYGMITCRQWPSETVLSKVLNWLGYRLALQAKD